MDVLAYPDLSERPFQVAVALVGAVALITLARWNRTRARAKQRRFAPPSWRYGLVPGVVWGAFVAVAFYGGAETVPPYQPATVPQLLFCFLLPVLLMTALYGTGVLRRLERGEGKRPGPGGHGSNRAAT